MCQGQVLGTVGHRAERGAQEQVLDNAGITGGVTS